MPLKDDYTSNEVLQASDFNALVSVVNSAEQTANKSQPGGYAALDSNGRVPASQLPNSVLTYEGVHNVSTNTPTLTDATGDAGQVYRVSVGGTRNYGSGNLVLNVGDYLIHSGSVWEVADTTDAVATVNGYTGSVTLTKSDVGLGNVDNTSDATKNSDTATLTNKTINLGNNTVSGNLTQFNSALTDADFATIAGSETLTSKTLTNPTINAYTEGVEAIGTVGSSSTLSIANGTVLTATLTASTACTFTMPTATAGKSFTLLLKQAASTGNGTATFTGVKWGVAGTPVVTAAAGKMDIFTFFSDGTNWYGSAAQGYTP